MYALEDGEMREEDKKKEWGLQAKIQQVRHILLFFFPLPSASIALSIYTPEDNNNMTRIFHGVRKHKLTF